MAGPPEGQKHGRAGLGLGSRRYAVSRLRSRAAEVRQRRGRRDPLPVLCLWRWRRDGRGVLA